SLAGLIGGAHSSSVKRLVSLAVQAQPQPPTDGAGKEKTVKSLIKRLKKNEQAKLLERALSEQNAATACVTATVGDSADPEPLHVVACRLWRWPDLQTPQELRPLDHCQHPYRSRFVGDLCVNPMHYQRLLAGATSQEPVIVYSAAAAIAAAAAAGPVFSFNGAAAGTSGSTASSPTTACAPSPPLSNQAMQQQLQQQLGGLLSVPYMDAEHWCSVHYYELSSRVGDAYYATSPFVTVDGGTNPSGRGRFCLGLLSNVNRTLAVEQTRRSIGSGVGLYYVNGEVHAECLSDSPVFIQSPNGNIRHNWHPATVCRIPPGCNLCVFSIRDFGNQLRQSAAKSFDEVYALTKMCTIRIAFVKGWGSEYRRQLVTATPCWIEVHLNGPLRWLDQVLSTMGSPNYG
uniref:Mothers against decapentaplegic homolog n=1 Tax=Macrostomum lignano TaxID=282301 RepID=A0A1I8JG30_9PLAT